MAAGAGCSAVTASIAQDLHDAPVLDRWPSALAIDHEKENLAGASL
jgi:hypothetical protein